MQWKGLSDVIAGAAVAAVAIGPLMFAATASRAHTAPSGMDYDASCCGGHDCRQLDDGHVQDELMPVPDGWIIVPTGEHLLDSDRIHVKTSTDGHFHRCSANNGDVRGHTYCLYIPSAA